MGTVKIVAHPLVKIERIDEPWAWLGMCALVGDKEIAFLKNGGITVMTLEELDQMTDRIQKQIDANEERDRRKRNEMFDKIAQAYGYNDKATQ